MRTLQRDLRHALRLLRRSPAFSAVAALTLALGIAVTTTVFTWVDVVLLRALPGTSRGEQLVAFESLQPDGEGHNVSFADYRDYRDQLQLLAGLAVTLQPHALSLGEGERAERVWGELVSGNYFDVLGVTPVAGRFFAREEQGDAPGSAPVAVISARLWRSRFRADPGVVGRTIRVNRVELTIVGVSPAQFRGITRGLVFDMWVPLVMGPALRVTGGQALGNRRARMLQAIGRLQPGTGLEEARAEIAGLARQLAATHPESNTGVGATIVPEARSHAGAQSLMRRPLQLLLAMSVVVLLIACVNVANLLFARSTSRQRELSIRLATGARHGQLVRQLLTETLLLAGLGALIGVPLAAWMHRWLMYLAPASIGLPVGFDLRTSTTVLGFAILVCVSTTLLAGLWPALHALRGDPNEALKEGGRSTTSGARSARMRDAFVVCEIALAFVALIGAGLFVRSFRAAVSVHPGFDAGDVVVSRFYLSTSGYTAEQRDQFCRRLRDRLASVPGITGVSYADTIPLGFGLGPGHKLEVEGYQPQPGEDMVVARSVVAPGYLAVMRMPLVRGREFSESDGRDAPIMIVNEAFSRRFFGERDPIGRRVRAWGRWCRIVGLVRDSKYYSLTEAHRPYFYAPFSADVPSDVAFYVRGTGDRRVVVATLRRHATALDPNAGAFDAMPLSEYITAPLFGHRIAASLLSILGVLSLLLGGVGLYGVMAHGVSQRTHEFGVRMALGARGRDVLSLVMRQGMRRTAAGLAIGAIAGLASARVVRGMLVDVGAADPLTFTVTAAFLSVVALLASYLPARRAARVDPMVALRDE